MKIVKMNDHDGEVIFKNMDTSIINALRRIMIAEIPVYAISVVLVEKNNSKMNEEYLVHRLGLIPFIQGDTDYNIEDELNNYEIELNVNHFEGPDDFKNVYAKDLFVKNELLLKNFVPVHPNIFICKLMKGNEIRLKCKLLKGTGKEHARWSVVSSAIYKNIPKLTIETEDKSLLKTCPVDIFKEKSGKIVVNNPSKCIYCFQCEENVNIKRDEKNILFQYESIGVLKPREILKQSKEILIKKLQDFKESIIKIEEI